MGCPARGAWPISPIRQIRFLLMSPDTFNSHLGQRAATSCEWPR